MEINEKRVLFKTGGVLGRWISKGGKRRKEWGIAEKGATLIELVVVFAVLAIISTVVISFVMMSNENVKASRDKVDALNDISVVESIVESWVEKYSSDEHKKHSFNVSDDEFSISIYTDSLHTYTLCMKGDELKEIDSYNTYINDVNTVVSTEKTLYTSVAIKSIKFYCDTTTEEENVNDQSEIIKRHSIVYCYITYGKNDYVYTFTVYPYNFIGTEEVQ